MGVPGSPVESSIEIPAIPVLTASATLAPTPSGSLAKPSRKSPLTGSGTLSLSARKCASVCSSDDWASRRPCDHAKPELVVAEGGKAETGEQASAADVPGVGNHEAPGLVELTKAANAIGCVGHGRRVSASAYVGR